MGELAGMCVGRWVTGRCVCVGRWARLVCWQVDELTVGDWQVVELAGVCVGRWVTGRLVSWQVCVLAGG